MSENKYVIVESKNKNVSKITKQIITREHLGALLLFLLSIIAGAVLPHLPEKYQLMPLFVFPALIGCLYILSNPYIGVYLYFLYEFLRPYDFIPALLPLRFAMVVEILTLLSWVLYLARTKDKINWSKFNWVFLAFLTVIGLTVITSVNNRLAYNTFQVMMVDFIIFVIATNVVDSFKRLNNLIWLLLLIHFFLALKGIYHYAVIHTVVAGQQTSGIVGSGYLGDENDFAMALNIMIPFAFFLVIYSRGKIKKFIGFVLLVTFVFGVICSFSRGGWLGLTAALLYCILKSKRRLVSLSLALLLGLSVIMLTPSSYWKEVETISDIKDATAQTRIDYWKAALRMYEDHPIIGVGAGNGGIWMPEYVTGFEYPATQWGRAFHGTIPQVMAELGSLGLVCYLLMLIYFIKFMSRLRKLKVSEGDSSFVEFVADSVIGGIIGFLSTAIFLSVAYYPQLWTLYTIGMSLFYWQGLKSTNSDKNHTGFSLQTRISSG